MYLVRADGHIFHDNGAEMEYRIENGFREITIMNGRGRMRVVPLIASTFLGIDFTLSYVIYIDGNRLHDNVTNLRATREKYLRSLDNN